MESFVVRMAEIVLSYGVILALFWAFFDASRFTPEQYRATGKMPRTPWLLAIGLAIVLDFWLGGFRFSDPVGARSLTWIAGVLVLVVYVHDMRPKLVRERLAGA